MIEIQTVLAELFDGEIAGGRNFWYEKDSNVILTQEWEHKASGRVNEAVEAFYVEKNPDMVQYIATEWHDYKIKDVVEVEGL